jgi:hypothetical protein
MFTDEITVTDGTVPATYSRISQDGMNSKRRHTTAASNLDRALDIKHTIPTADSGKNRHMASLSGVEVVSGIAYRRQVHVVITRDKLASDTAILQDMKYLINFLSDANISKLLLGGN